MPAGVKGGGGGQALDVSAINAGHLNEEGETLIKQAKGPRGKADRLFSWIVRHRGECQVCGQAGRYTDFHTAHLMSRRYSHTRCDERNALCACPGCHFEIDADFALKGERAIDVFGIGILDELYDRRRLTTKVRWVDEVERLEERCDELGIGRPA